MGQLLAGKLDLARARLPLRRLMEQFGRSPGTGNWKRFPACPYCGRDGAGLREHGGREWFKCFHATCRSGTAAEKASWDEVSFVAYERQLQRREAFIDYLKRAGVWEDRAPSPPMMPGKAGHRNTLPEAEVSPPTEYPPEERFEDLPSTVSPQPDPAVAKLAAGPPPVLSGGPESQPQQARTAVYEGAAGEGAALTSPPASPPAPGGDSTLPHSAAAEAPALTVEAQGPAQAPPAASSEEPNDGTVPPEIRALRWFYRRLHLSDKDQTMLWTKRGLTAATMEMVGLRSNPRSNLALLESMAEVFPVGVLIGSGLWSELVKPGGKTKPNPQFYGMSLVEQRDASGKKIRDPEGRAVREPKWDEPILIPYFDTQGELVHLRPHKGMMAEKSPRFYMVRPSKEWIEKHKPVQGPPELWVAQPEDIARDQQDNRVSLAVIAEGEFKAIALWQVLNAKGARFECASLPGITMAKLLSSDVEEWLEDSGARQVVTAYDNEEKGDPKLPGFQTDKWKRYDAQVWARYLARQLGKVGYDSKVCLLPNTWRDPNGKADWDGYLARRLAELWDEWKDAPQEAAPGMDASPMRAAARSEFWGLVHEKVRAECLEVLKTAAPVHELWQAGSLDSEAERIIKNGLERISYEPELPIGGKREEAIARRLQRLVARTRDGDRLEPKARGFLMVLAKAYLETTGAYYVLKPLTEQKAEEWNLRLARASDLADTEVKRACEIARKGIPKRVSDFYFEPLYVLKLVNGTRVRVVRIINRHGLKTDELQMPGRALAHPSDCREWLLNVCTAANWKAGQEVLDCLREDMGHALSFRGVEEVPVQLYHEESHSWFAGDVTYDPEGQKVFGDENGIVRVDGRAYKRGDTDHEKQSFRHGEVRFGIVRDEVDWAIKMYGVDWKAQKRVNL